MSVKVLREVGSNRQGSLLTLRAVVSSEVRVRLGPASKLTR